jgi:hypothetical protein
MNAAIMVPIVMMSVVALVVVLMITAQRKRLRELQHTFASAGFTCMFHPDGLTRSQAFSHAGGMQALRTGERGIQWAARGTINEREVWVMEHRYTSGSGKNRSTHYHTIICTPGPHTWPDLSLTTENLFHKIGELFGGKDIQVESEAFNKRWRVKCDNEDFAVLVLSPQVQEWCMSLERGLWLRIGQGAVCVVKSGVIGAKDLQRLASLPTDLYKLFPPELDAFGS